MRVIQFDTKKGFYQFEFESLTTEFHSHPAVEIIKSEGGTFHLYTGQTEFENIQLAIINRNVQHKVKCTNAVGLTLLEHTKTSDLEQDVIVNSNEALDFSKLYPPTDINLHEHYDSRIAEVIHYIQVNNPDYNHAVTNLLKIIPLSSSRLSHLFKKEVGISLKKFLVWHKLKSAIRDHLHEKDDLLSALLKSGFYDQPHFSKAFKNMLGVQPSMVYNSRMLQG